MTHKQKETIKEQRRIINKLKLNINQIKIQYKNDLEREFRSKLTSNNLSWNINSFIDLLTKDNKISIQHQLCLKVAFSNSFFLIDKFLEEQVKYESSNIC